MDMEANARMDALWIRDVGLLKNAPLQALLELSLESYLCRYSAVYFAASASYSVRQEGQD